MTDLITLWAAESALQAIQPPKPSNTWKFKGTFVAGVDRDGKIIEGTSLFSNVPISIKPNFEHEGFIQVDAIFELNTIEHIAVRGAESSGRIATPNLEVTLTSYEYL